MAQTFGLLPTCVWLFTALITTNKATNQQFVGQMYFGSLEYVLVSGIKETNTTLQNLTEATTQTFKDNLHGTDGFLAIEIYKIFVKESSVNLNFVVHMNGTLDLNVVQGRIKTKLSSSSTNLSATFIPVGSPVNVRIYNKTPIDLCSLKNFKNRCDPNSTKCKQNKETVKCECRGGFENRTVIEGVGICHQIKDPKDSCS
ncbi:uncharacterized protein LOC127840359 [Dreissena polymorpha]|uniref:uncharacterized protein LOC127840359 n=1 Tax=Dreissena polymorpha TaxID=45954 RepID=UPI0022656EFA|nr:uncharacterized protein LOC127840359 [Dreissena polymorpha]